MTKEAMLQALKVLSGCLEHPDAQDAMDALTLAIEQAEKQEPVCDMGATCIQCPAAPREWVGLTDQKIREEWFMGSDYDDFARAIEAKLKEKNNG